MSRTRISDATWIDLLNRLVLKPRLAAAARAVGISQASVFLKIRQSIEAPADHQVFWLEQSLSFADAVALAKKLSIIELDRGALQLAMEGHSTPRYHDGKPVFKTDLQVAADALTMEDWEWEATYPERKSRTDVWARDEKGRLIQEMVVSPPNPQLVNKLLASLIPNVYSERIEHDHHVSGGVVIEGRPAQAQLPAPSHDNLFDLTTSGTGQQRRATNVLAVPRTLDKDTFDKKWMKPLVREVVLFRDAAGKLMPPLVGEEPDIVVIGTPQYHEFKNAGIEVNAVHPQELLEQGYRNDFLFELCPNWKEPPKPKPVRPTDEQREEIAQQVEKKIAARANASASSPYEPQEKIGRGQPPVGGFKVLL
jgi:hypothetical protein